MFDEVIKNMCLFAETVINFINDFFKSIIKNYLSVSKKYGRIKYLAFHSKKARTRKKNAGRLLDILLYELKNMNAITV